MSKLTLTTDSFFCSPYALSAFVTLFEKKLAFELKTVSLAQKAQHAPAFVAASLTARVPLLTHGDFCLSESSAIDEYLEDVFPAPAYARVYPQDAQQRARARQIQAWVRSDLMPIREQLSAETVFYAEQKGQLNAAGEAAAAKLLRIAGALLGQQKDYLFGQWCIADTDLAMMLMRLIQNEVPVPAPIKAYAQHQWARPSVAAWVNQARQPFVAY